LQMFGGGGGCYLLLFKAAAAALMVWTLFERMAFTSLETMRLYLSSLPTPAMPKNSRGTLHSYISVSPSISPKQFKNNV